MRFEDNKFSAKMLQDLMILIIGPLWLCWKNLFGQLSNITKEVQNQETFILISIFTIFDRIK